jgi:outer membrane protein TolC
VKNWLGALLPILYLGSVAAIDVAVAKTGENAAIPGKRSAVIDNSNVLLSLREVVEMALKNNASLRQESLRKKEEEHNLGIQRARFLPTVDAVASYTRGVSKNIEDAGELTDYNEATGEIALRQNLFNSGVDLITFRYKKYGLQVYKYYEEEKAQSIVYDAVLKYYNILFLEANRDVAQESENSYLELLKSIKASHGVGLASSIDRLQAENSYQTSRLDVMDADNKLKDSYADLNVFLARDPNYAINLEKPKIEIKKETISADEYIRLALINRPDLKRMRELQKQAKEGLRLARMSLFPSFTVDFASRIGTGPVMDRSTNTSKFNRGKIVTDTYVVAAVKIPVFSGLSTLNSIRIKEKALEIIDLQLEELEREISKEVLVACRNFDYDQVAFFLSKDLLETKTSETRMVLDMYATGSKSLADVNRAQAELEKTKLNFIKFKHSWLTRRINLLKLTGMINLESVINVSGF